MNANWIILLIGLSAGAIPTWWVTADHYQGVLAKEHKEQQKLVIEQQEQNRLDLLAYANVIVKGVAEHDKNSRIIRTLSRERERLRVNFPTCPVPGDAEAGANSNGAAGTLPNPVDALFERLQSRTGSIIERCDTLNIDAIRANQTRYLSHDTTQ